jgi:type II secretory pathway pseudopilin PulG
MKRRRGFTMIELITVIGLVILMIAMLFPTLKYLAHASEVHTTRQMLISAQIMQGNFEQARRPSRDPSTFIFWNTGTPAITVPTYINWCVSWTSQYGTQMSASAIAGFTGAQNPATRIAVSDVTRVAIMSELYALPDNAKISQQVPARQVLQWASNTAGTNTWSANSVPNVPVLLDGWGFPIIFVPAGGLTNVLVGAQYNSAGLVVGTGTTVTITSPDNRPFWASPGMTGDFSRGDSNLYSFGN